MREDKQDLGCDTETTSEELDRVSGGIQASFITGEGSREFRSKNCDSPEQKKRSSYL